MTMKITFQKAKKFKRKKAKKKHKFLLFFNVQNIEKKC